MAPSSQESEPPENPARFSVGRLPEHEPHYRRGEQGAELVLQGRQSLRRKLRWPVRKLLIPERAHGAVAAEPDDPGAVVRIAHHPLHTEETNISLSVGVIEDRRDRTQ